MPCCADPHQRRQPGAQRVSDRPRRSCARAGGRARRPARRLGALATARSSGRAQRQLVHTRSDDHRRLPDPRALCPSLQRDGRRAIGRGRRRDRRQDQLRRVCDGIVNRELRLWPDPQSVVTWQDAWRIERRIGGSRGGAHGAAGARLRHRRLPRRSIRSGLSARRWPTQRSPCK